MSADDSGLVARTQHAQASELPKAGSARPDRRRWQSRRASDHKQSALLDLVLWLWSRDPRPSLVVDVRLHVLLCNDAARAVLERSKSVRMRENTLALANERHQVQLVRWLADTSRSAADPFRPGRSAALTAIRVPARDAGRRLALITLTPATTPVGAQLQRQYGLTKAETEIALGIFRGATLVRIARDRKASINTVKTQARYVFQKCRVHSQTALTRRIGELLAP